MLKFFLKISNLLAVEGKGLKGSDLRNVLIFLAYIITLLVILFATSDLPKVQILF